MAISRVTTWSAGQVLTAAALNAEFNNILLNPIDLWSPAAKAVNFNGQTLTLDAATATTVSSSASQAWNFTCGSKSGTPSGTGGFVNWSGNTYTDTNTAGNGTAALFAAFAYQRPTLTATNASVVTTDAATLYIPNSPAAGTNETLTNAWSLYVGAGAVRCGGNLRVDGTLYSSGTIAASLGVLGASNFSLTATVASNNLTIALKDAAGNDPSATSPACFVFRNATLTTGTPILRQVTAATSLVINSTVTLGTTNNVAFRLYIVAMDNAGTVELAIWNSQATISLQGIDEATLYTSSTPGNLAQSLYSTSSRTNVAVRVIGYIEITEATAGTWATAPTVVQCMGIGVNRTGMRVQEKFTTYATQTENDTNTYADTGLTLSITPRSAINLVKATVHQSGLAEITNPDSGIFVQLMRGSTSLIVNYTEILSGQRINAALQYLDNPAATTSTTYKTQFKHSSNNAGAIVQYSSTTSSIMLEEIFA